MRLTEIVHNWLRERYPKAEIISRIRCINLAFSGMISVFRDGQVIEAPFHRSDKTIVSMKIVTWRSPYGDAVVNVMSSDVLGNDEDISIGPLSSPEFFLDLKRAIDYLCRKMVWRYWKIDALIRFDSRQCSYHYNS